MLSKAIMKNCLLSKMKTLVLLTLLLATACANTESEPEEYFLPLEVEKYKNIARKGAVPKDYNPKDYCFCA